MLVSQSGFFKKQSLGLELGYWILDMGFPCDSAGKNLPAVRETWVQSLGWEDPLEKGKDTHSSILAWRIPGTVLIHGVAESDMTEWLKKKKKVIYLWGYPRKQESVGGESKQGRRENLGKVCYPGWSCELDSTETSEELPNVSQDCAHVPFNFCPFVWGLSLGMLSPSPP